MSQYPGRIVLDIDPTENNPRNSEGAFIKLKNGDLLFVYSHFAGDVPADFAPACLEGRISRNEGISWTTPVILEDAPGGYCYTAIFFEGDHVLLGYCAGQVSDSNTLARLRVRRIGLGELGIE